MQDAVPEGLFETKKIVETAAMRNIRKVRRILANPMNEKYFSRTTPWNQRASWNSIDRTEGKIGVMHVSPTEEFYKASTCPLALTDYATLYVMDDQEDKIPAGVPYKGIDRLDKKLKHVFDNYIVGRDSDGNKVPPMSRESRTYIYGICDGMYCARHPDIIDFFADNIDCEVSYYNEEEDRKHRLIVFPVNISVSTWHTRDNGVKAYDLCKVAHFDNRVRDLKKDELITGIIVSDIPRAVDDTDREGDFCHALRKLEAKRATEQYTYKTYVDNIENLGLEKWWYMDAMANFNARHLSHAFNEWLNRTMFTYVVGIRKDIKDKFMPVSIGKFIDRMTIRHVYDSYAKKDEYRYFMYSGEFAKFAREHGAEKYYAQEYVPSVTPFMLGELDQLTCTV